MATERPKRKRVRIPKPPNEQFVSVWNAAASTREAAEKTGLTVRYASVWASYLRSRGLTLKKFPRGREPRISLATFVPIWNAANSVADAAQQLGLSPNGTQSRATYYRRKGLPLKRFHQANLVSAAEFQSVWNASSNVPEAATRMGISLAYARRRAAWLRRKGIQLKLFRAPRTDDPANAA
jgi:predicted XRE-type DNA-binding protein